MTLLKKIIALFVIVLLLCGCQNDNILPLADAFSEDVPVSNGGIAAKKGEWIYFINGDNFTRGEGERFHEFAGALCRMRADGTEKDVVVNTDVSLFNICGDRIVLCVYENGKSRIASVSLDGTDYKILRDIDDIYYGGCYAFAGNYIFYTESFKLYRIDTDGKNRTKLTDFKVYNLFASEKYIYFTRENNGSIGNIYKCEKNSEDCSEVTKDAAYVLNANGDVAYFYMLGNGTVYEYNAVKSEMKPVIYGGYTEYAFGEDYVVSCSGGDGDEENSGIFVIPSGGGQKKQISENYGKCMVCLGEYVYYINASKLNYLYRCRLDGTEDVCISEEYVFDYDMLDITDNYIYFFSDGDYDRVYRVNIDTSETECVELEDIAVIG